MTWSGWLDTQLAQIRGRDQWRTCRIFDPSGADGQAVVSFAANDYLALSSHPDVLTAGHQALDRWGAGAGSSRLVVGTRPVHAELETALADWKGTEAAVLFSTGYTANLGVLSALRGDDVTIFSDQLNHASIVDGCRLSRAQVVAYPHRDMEELGNMLRRSTGRAVVVSETVFSMDGDVAPVDRLTALCAEFEALLVLDEAHGVLGPPLGSLPHDLDLILVGTLSKGLGSLGGFVAASRRWVDWLVNRARPLIFTTAPTPADTAAALAALRILRSDRGKQLASQLRAHVDLLLPGHPSPIIPVVLGSERHALDAAAALLKRGLLVPAIRPPTVPPGTSRLRIALSAGHTVAQVACLREALDSLGLEPHASPSP